MPRTCAHCGHPIDHRKRESARFCKPSCRVNHHVANRVRKPITRKDIATVRIAPLEAGLLLDCKRPWWPAAGLYERYWYRMAKEQNAKKTDLIMARMNDREDHAMRMRVRRGFVRLAELGLVEIGQSWSGQRQIIRRTDLGDTLVRARRKELEAEAEHIGEAEIDPKYASWG